MVAYSSLILRQKMAARACNWYQRLGLNKWNTNFRLEHFVRKNRTTFSDVTLLPEIFHWNDPKFRVPFTFQPENGKQPTRSPLDFPTKLLTFILRYEAHAFLNKKKNIPRRYEAS